MDDTLVAGVSLAGRRALVTGGGRGIGRAIAFELAARGAQVTVLGRERAVLEQSRDLIRAAGGQAEALPADLLEAPSGAARECLEALDVLVHNATAFPEYGMLEEASEDDLRRVYAVGVLAPIRWSALALPGMKRRGFGRILFVGSVAATAGARRQAPYASAKAALHGLVRSLALECAPHGVTCNLIEPGLVLTERVKQRIPEQTRQALVAATPLGRAGEPAEIAAVAGFLCSPAASYITGAIVPVAGGLGLGVLPPPRA